LFSAGDARHQRIHGQPNIRVHDEQTGCAINVTFTVPSPTPGSATAASLSGVTALSATNIWAVGNVGDQSALALHCC